MKEKDRLNRALGGGGGKSFLASILFIFFLIPHILDARTVHRRAYMVCPGGEAYWDANRQQSVCCLGRVKQKIDGSYICNCSSNSDCPENHICMKDGTCRGCVEGYTTYCSVFEGDACIEAGCSTVEDCVQKRLGDLGQCCAESAEVYYSSYDANGNGIVLNCCTGTPYCSTYLREGVCSKAYCGTKGCTPYVYMDLKGACCSPSSTVISDTSSNLQACCSNSDYVAYCAAYNNDGSCNSLGCCASTSLIDIAGIKKCCSSGSGYCNQYNIEGVCIEATCCSSGQVASDNGYGDWGCCSSGYRRYCSDFDEAGNCLRSLCAKEPCHPYRETISVPPGGDDIYDGYYSGGCCDKNLTVFSSGVGACCSNGQAAYCLLSDANGCIEASCCSSGYQPYQKYQNEQACCSSLNSVVLDGEDGLQACCLNNQTAYCSERDNRGVCIAMACGVVGCIPYETSSTTFGCCKPDRLIEVDGRQVCSDGKEECSEDTVRYYSSSSTGVECCAPDLLSDSIDGLQVCNCSGTVYCSEYSGNKCQKVSCCSSGTPVRISETAGTCCTGTIKNLAGFDYGLCCTNATAQPYCFDYQDGQCVSAACCRGTPYCMNYDFDGQCISSTCRSDSTCTPYRKSLFQGACCEPGYVVKTVENGMEACCYASFDAYCSEETNGLCSEASCCNGEVYQKTLTEKGCCESGYKVSHFGSGIDACCSSRYTAYCGSYNAQGECISAYCSSSCTPYRVSATSGSCCSSSKVVKPLSNGYEICCNATDEVYWNGSSSACCTSDKVVTKESFDGAQACVVADYTTAYCSSYVNGLCNRVSASYISGGCTPYRKSATEGGCCSGSVIKSGDYETCI